MLYKNPPPYFIVLASSVKTKEVEVIEFHRMDCMDVSLCMPMQADLTSTRVVYFSCGIKAQ